MCVWADDAEQSTHRTADMWVEFRSGSNMDALRTEPADKATYFDDVTEETSQRTQRHITSFAAEQFLHQHRTFIFSILICGTNARFIRWDHAGAIASRHFDYQDDSSLLAEFFWRYGHISSPQRGVDSTVRRASSFEQESLRVAVVEYMADPNNRQIAHMDKTLDQGSSCSNVAISGVDGAIRHYIIQRPLSSLDSPFGRCTRAYVALDVAENELVFLKDYWRPLDASRRPEAEIYAELQASAVPHLPRVRLGGDVLICDPNQTTLAQKRANAEGIFKSESFRGYKHHRIVQDLAYGLSYVRSSRELVAAVSNALDCKSALSC